MSDNEKKSKLFKKIGPNAKSTIRLKKIFSFLLVAYIIVFIMILTKNKYGSSNQNILEKLGSNIETNITIDKTLKLKKLSIDAYKNYLINLDYESAYNMLTDEYKYYCDYESFVNYANSIDWTTLDVEDINAKSDYCYVASVVYKMNNELQKTKYILYVNRYVTDSINISPDNFIYAYKNQDFEKDGVKLHIDECVISINNVYLKGSIENTSWFSDINIKSIDAAFGSSLVEHYPLEKVLKKGETVPLDILFDEKVEYFIPDNIKVQTKDGEKVLSYSFYFKENE